MGLRSYSATFPGPVSKTVRASVLFHDEKSEVASAGVALQEWLANPPRFPRFKCFSFFPGTIHWRGIVACGMARAPLYRRRFTVFTGYNNRDVFVQNVTITAA